MDVLNEMYNFIMKDSADPRTHSLPFMTHPWAMLIILIIYLYTISVFLPKFMVNRKPYGLKKIILCYNFYQVLACASIIYWTATSGWTTYYTFGCQLIDYSQLADRMVYVMWWYMILKMSELLETIFFVLRKKWAQVSTLHVYHHASTFVLSWICCKYFPGGMTTFTLLINSFVHILMYTYYLLSACGPRVQSKLQMVKSKLTMLQIIQLLVIFIHTSQMFLPSCKYPKSAAFIYLPNVGLNIFLFLKFYINNYYNKKKLF